MNKKLFAIFGTLVLTGCNLGSNSGTAPTNAFSQLLNGNEFIEFNYSPASLASLSCQNLIAAASQIYYTDSGAFAYSYNANNSSAQLCDKNNQNCLNSNNTNTPCISGTINLESQSTDIVWNNCSYESGTFSAQLQLTNVTESCSGVVTGYPSLRAQGSNK